MAYYQWIMSPVLILLNFIYTYAGSPVASDINRCGAGTVELTSVGANGDINWWYDTRRWSHFEDRTIMSTPSSSGTDYWVSSYI
jgi:hypothetical protein